MRKLFYLFLLLNITITVQSQECYRASWVKTVGGVNSGQSIIDVEQHPDGGFVVCGNYASTGIILNSVSLPAGDGGFWLAHADSSGVYDQLAEILPLNLVNIKRINVLSDGSVAVACNLIGNFTLGDETFDIHNGNRALLVKFNSDFQYEWHVSSSNMNASVDTRDLSSDSDGNIYWCGNFDGDFFVIDDTWLYKTLGKVWLCKISSTGSLEWINQLGSANSTGAQTVSVDSENNVWISGATSMNTINSFRFSDQLQYPGFLNSANSMYIGKYDPDGKCLWGQISTTAVTNQSIYAWDSAAGSDGSMIFCGRAVLTHYIGGKAINGDDGSGFLFRMDADGNMNWVQTMGGQGSGEEAYRLHYRDGKISVNGTVFSNQTYIGDFPAYSLTNTSARQFNAMFYEDGSLEFTRVYDQDFSNHYIYDTSIDADGQQVIFGHFKSTQTWYPISLTHSGSVAKLYIAKFREAVDVAFSISAGPDKNTNCATNVQLNGSTTPSSGVDFGWYPSIGFSMNTSKTPTLQLTAPGSFVFTGYYQGCVLTDTVNVVLDNYDVTVDIDESGEICKGDTLDVTAVSNQPGATFLWTPNYRITSTTTPEVGIFANASLSYVVEATYDGCKAKDTIDVTVHPSPTIYIPYNQFYGTYQMHTCEGNIIEADLGLPENTYEISLTDNIDWVNNHEVIFTAIENSYGGTITATSPAGCVSSIPFSVYGHNYQDPPPVINQPNDTVYVCPGTGQVYEEIVNITSDYIYNPLDFQYSWYSGWQVDSLDGLGWRDIEYYDFGHYTLFPYSVGEFNSYYYVQLEFWNVHASQDGFKFRAYINDICSERVYTEQMVLRVGPVIENQTSDITICEGGNGTLLVETEAEITSWQWEVFHDGAWIIVVDGENNITFNNGELYISNAQSGMDSLFRCRTVGCSPNLFVYSDEIHVNIQESELEIPSLITDPVCEGDDAFISLNPADDNFVYQWYADGDVINDTEGLYSGTTTGVLQIHNVTTAQAEALFKCSILSEQCGQDIFTGEINIEVLAKPEVSWNYEIDVLCENAEPVELNGATPGDGIFYGSGVADNLLDPALAIPGEHVYTYSYTDTETGCSNEATHTILIASLPDVSFILPDNDLCNSDGVIELSGGNPSSGIYSGGFVTTEDLNTYLFDTPGEGTGEYEIQYTFTDANNCSATALDTIEVNASTPITWITDIGIFCSGSTSVSIEMPQPTGGEFSGAEVIDGQLVLENLSQGEYELSYFYTNIDGCTSEFTSSFTLNGVSATWDEFQHQYCEGDPDITLTGGTPEGGDYSGMGVNDGVFQPSSIDVGFYNLEYIYYDELSGCSDTAFFEVNISEIPEISWTAEFDPQCFSDSSLYIANAIPDGGIYFGGIIEDGYLDLASLTEGENILTYFYSSEQGCENSADAIVILQSTPSVEWDLSVTAFCSNLPYEIDLNTLVTPTGGSFYCFDYPVTGNIWTWEPFGFADTTILYYEYTDPETGCAVLSQQEIIIDVCGDIEVLHDAPIFTFFNGDQFRINTTETTQLRVYDLMGNLAWEKEIPDGVNTYRLELAAASYLVQLNNRSELFSYKIVVSH